MSLTQYADVGGRQNISDTSKSIATCGENAKEERSGYRQTEVSAWKKVVVNAKSDPFSAIPSRVTSVLSKPQ